MARERMAKLIKYDHFEGRIGHIIIYFISRRGPKMSMIHEDYVSQNLNQSE